MIADPDTYAGALANVAGSLNDGELRSILGHDKYKDFQNELGGDFNTGWDRSILANAPIAPGFMASRAMGFVKGLESFTRSSAVIRQASQLSRKAVNYTLKPFKKFGELPKAQKDACIGIAMNLCGSGSVVDDLMKQKTPYSLPTGPSKYNSAGELIIHPRRFLDKMNASGVN